VARSWRQIFPMPILPAVDMLVGQFRINRGGASTRMDALQRGWWPIFRRQYAGGTHRRASLGRCRADSAVLGEAGNRDQN